MVTPLTANGRISSSCIRVVGFAIAAMSIVVASHAQAAPPKIRTDASNKVPACVTPKRLMAFIKTRNSDLDPRFADIAAFYKKHGDTWHVRWDYAFFQMAVETNFLSYRRGDGGWGDVDPKQNNFAGLGTTGGGVPGDAYPDVTTGVLAQIQHLVVYSGEHIDNPVGARTRLKQDDIIETMASKHGTTTFSDLSRRWAADRHYGASIEWVANGYRQMFCKGPDPVEAAEAPKQKPVKRSPPPQQELAQAANLGGPEPAPAVEAAPETKPAVRTIWSANADADTASTPGMQAQPEPQPTVREARVAPMPSRKPTIEVATETGPVVTEQMIQTGEDPAPAVTTAEKAEPAAPLKTATNALASDVSTTSLSATPSAPATATAAEPTSQRPVAFAYAAGLGSTLPKARTAPGATTGCKVSSASYGGKKILLVRTADTTQMRFTVLTVLEGFEKSMLDSYLKAHAPGGSSVGEFASKNAAFAKARELCPSAAGAPNGEGANAG
jgi:hypothetical protein